jgi:tetratricopeptide (TPR) repeat protein
MPHPVTVQPKPDAPSPIEARVRHARSLVQKRQFVPALTAAQTLRAEVPENRDVLYLIAVCQRYLGYIPDALATLEHIEDIHPDYGRLFQERGHCHRWLGNAKAALMAYEQAVNLNHTLTASWKALVALRHSLGREAQAQAAAVQVSRLASLPARDRQRGKHACGG